MNPRMKLALDQNLPAIASKLAKEYGTTVATTLGGETFTPSYALHRGSIVPVLHSHTPARRELALQNMRWGLLPSHGTVDISIPIVEANTVADGGKFLWALLRSRKRCAVVCEGFFVWRKTKVPGENRKKELTPSYFKPNPQLNDASPRSIILLAGLYDYNSHLHGRRNASFTLLVSKHGNGECLSPIILHRVEDLVRWLDTTSLLWSADLTTVVTSPLPLLPSLTSHRVLPHIENATANGPSLTLPLSERHDGVRAHFHRQAQTPNSSQPTRTRRRALKPKSTAPAIQTTQKDRTLTQMIQTPPTRQTAQKPFQAPAAPETGTATPHTTPKRTRSPSPPASAAHDVAGAATAAPARPAKKKRKGARRGSSVLRSL